MLALYRSGRQADALQVYQDTRRVLVEELGLEPSKAVELEQAILRQDPALDVCRPRRLGPQRRGPSRKPSSWGANASSPLSSPHSATRSPAAGGSWSSAASRGSARAASRRSWGAGPGSHGAEIHWGRCWEEGGAPPYWPWVQVLRACVRERGAEQLADELGPGAAEVAELVPDVRTQLPELRIPSDSADPLQVRFRLFDAVSGFLTERVAPGPS